MADRPEDTGRRILFSAQKNEGKFLLEWIAFHKVVGFTDIIIFSNDCDDGSDDFLDKLASAGEIVHYKHDVPSDVPPQINAVTIAHEMDLFQNGDWVMWLDIDEYLYIEAKNHTLSDLFEIVTDADAIGFAWHCFGDGGNSSWPGRQISKDFVTASLRGFPPNLQIKTLFKFSEAIKTVDIHRPLFQDSITANDYRFYHSGNQPMPTDFLHKTYRNGAPFSLLPTGARKYILGKVNHYAIRTPDMFENKKRRGNGYVSNDNPNRHHLIHQTDKFYNRFNRNHLVDEKILALRDDLDVEYDRIERLVNNQKVPT